MPLAAASPYKMKKIERRWTKKNKIKKRKYKPVPPIDADIENQFSFTTKAP